jgi:hypothetical protein
MFSGLSNIYQKIWSKSEAPTSVHSFSFQTLDQSRLAYKAQTISHKGSSLFSATVSGKRKKFYNIDLCLRI